MKILLVDDSSTMRRIQKNILAGIGYTDVDEANDGVNALKKLEATKFDLVMMDWNMPNMTGIDALRKIKSDPALKSVMVIMVTSETEGTRIMEAIHAGASDYIVKPFQADSLQEKISALDGP